VNAKTRRRGKAAYRRYGRARRLWATDGNRATEGRLWRRFAGACKAMGRFDTGGSERLCSRPGGGPGGYVVEWAEVKP
jgi:hypothetical protein